MSFPSVGSRGRLNEIFVCLLIAAGFFLLVSATPDLPGGFDSYRHVKQASRYLHDPQTVFSNTWSLAYFWPKPVDAWFGFHVLLAPFTLVFPLVVAIKLLASLLFGGIAYALFQLLDHFGARYRTAWVLLALTGSSWALCRDVNTRPFLLSLLLTLLGVLFTVRQRPIPLFAVCALHAASYSMFFLAAFGPGVWLLLRRDRKALILAGSSAVGVIAGLLCNPFFPENVRFDLAVVGVTQIAARAHVIIGGELEPLTDWVWWIVCSLPVLSLWLLAVWFHLRQWRARKSLDTVDLLLVSSLITLLGTFQVKRTADFFVLFATVFAAAVLTPHLDRWRKDLAYAAVPLGIICCAYVGFTYSYVMAAPVLDRYRGAAEYLRSHAQGDLVANADWGDYQFLFYLNPGTNYVVGIEPTFMYLADNKKYWLWRHMADDEPSTCGRERCLEGERVAIGEAMRADLGAGYIFVQHAENPKVEKALQAEAGVREVFRDAGFSLYHLARSAKSARVTGDNLSGLSGLPNHGPGSF